MRKENRGFTLIELLIVVVVVAIGVTLAAASYSDIRNKRAVTNAAEAMASFLQVARSEAVKRNDPVWVRIDTGATIDGATTYCAAVAEATGCDCSSGTDYSCGIDVGASTQFNPWLKGTDFELIQAPTLSSGTAFNFSFDPVRGILDPPGQGNMTFVSNNGKYAMRVSMTVTGRVEVCTVTGTLDGETLVRVGGYDICG